MKKLVILIPNLSSAGAEKFVVDLATNIDQEVFDITVGITHTLEKTHFYDVLSNNNIRVVKLGGKNHFKTITKSIQFFRKEKTDIIHANIGSLLHILIPTILCRIKTRIFTVHSVATLVAGKNKFKKIVYFLSFRVFKFQPVAICDFVRKTVSEEYKIPLQKISCIYNGVDIEKFTPLNDPKKSRTTVEFVSTGTLYYIKNHRMMIEALSKVVVEYPDCHLTIIGDGELKEELQKQISDLKMEKNVHLAGRSNNVLHYLQNSDVYLSTSITEGLPLSVLEAMACGLPIIATEAGGIVDIVEEGVNGLLVDINDSEQFAAAIFKLLKSKDLIVEYGIQSRLLAEKHSLRNCVGQYEKLYKGQ